MPRTTKPAAVRSKKPARPAAGALATRLAEALEQQAATAEILRVISRSKTDAQPVFDSIAAAALKLCRANSAVVTRFDGTLIRLAAFANVSRKGANALRRRYPRPPSRDTANARAILTRKIVAIPDVLADAEYSVGVGAATAPFRSVLSVPLLRDGSPIGSLSIARPEPGGFPAEQVALLQTFADQAVIAIENVRLFRELEQRNSSLTESLEQQTATSDILRVISRSQTDVQPVFETIAANALRLCDARFSTFCRFDGEIIHLAVLHHVKPEGVAAFHAAYPCRPNRGGITQRAILTGSVAHVANVLEDPEYTYLDAAKSADYRSVLSVPLMRDGNPIGAISVFREAPEPFPDAQVELLKTFADQATIAIENVRLFTELGSRNRDLTEALEQQTATSEILRVISRSQTDVQPVFDTIAQSARSLCDATFSNVYLVEAEMLNLAASDGLAPDELAVFASGYPRRIGPDTVTGRAALESRVIQTPDLLSDPDYSSAPGSRVGARTVLGVPMLRHGKAIGSIGVWRGVIEPFSNAQIGLLQTFADQAVIAIENVRLFKELEQRNRALTESLEQQTATSEILRVISSTPTDVQPVFAAIVRSAVRLCGADHSVAARFDGEFLHPLAYHGFSPEALEVAKNMFPMRPGPQNMLGRMAETKAVVSIDDMLADPSYSRDFALAGGWRGGLAVPMIRDGTLIGGIAVSRKRPGAFQPSQIALLQTFADQAVIAIENVRLFKELEQRNRALTESLEQQTATSEILRVISRSQIDVQPVFETLVENAVRLCDADKAFIFRFDGEALRMAAAHNASPELKEYQARNPHHPGRQSCAARAALLRQTVQIPDAQADSEYAYGDPVVNPVRTVLGVPLLKGDQLLGVIVIYRLVVKPFTDEQIALMETFADQAVIAIENVRLFTELETRTTQLMRSVGELKALGEVGHAVSSTLDLPTVLSTIVSRASKLAGMDGGAIYEYDEATGEFHLHTTDGLPDELVAALRASPIPKGEGALGRMAVTGEPVQIRDIAGEKSYKSRLRETLIRLGYRSLLAVPLLRDDHLLGGLVVNRNMTGEFSQEVIDLLKTFATQSALAIQNARLFREIEVKSGQLETASRHKSEFLANMSHELRTPLNAIIGFSEVLSEQMFGAINDKQAEYLKDILESGRHLLSLINDILDLSKIEAGRMELEPSEFELSGAIDNALTLVRERANRHSIALGCEVDENLVAVRADERKVKQVLLNLLTNALKFTPEGGRVDVRARARDGFAEISVTDTGIGIAPADQAKVFEEFRQVGSTAKKIEGTGLGLAISRKFIELHGGRIWVESKLGAGSTFAFSLPLPPSSS